MNPVFQYLKENAAFKWSLTLLQFWSLLSRPHTRQHAWFRVHSSLPSKEWWRDGHKGLRKPFKLDFFYVCPHKLASSLDLRLEAGGGVYRNIFLRVCKCFLLNAAVFHGQTDGELKYDVRVTRVMERQKHSWPTLRVCVFNMNSVLISDWLC